MSHRLLFWVWSLLLYSAAKSTSVANISLPNMAGIIQETLAPKWASLALTLPAQNLLTWAKYRLFSLFDNRGYLVYPDHSDCSLVVYDMYSETPSIVVQVAGTPIGFMGSSMMQFPSALRLFVVTSKKRSRINEAISKLPPSIAIFSLHFGWIRLPPGWFLGQVESPKV